MLSCGLFRRSGRRFLDGRQVRLQFILNRRGFGSRRAFGRASSRRFPLGRSFLLDRIRRRIDQRLLQGAHDLVLDRALLRQAILQTAQQRSDHSVRCRLGDSGIHDCLPITAACGRHSLGVMPGRQFRDRLDDARDAGNGGPIDLLLRWRRSHRRNALNGNGLRCFYCSRRVFAHCNSAFAAKRPRTIEPLP